MTWAPYVAIALWVLVTLRGAWRQHQDTERVLAELERVGSEER